MYEVTQWVDELGLFKQAYGLVASAMMILDHNHKV